MSRHPFNWPSDLYMELQYMSQASFLSHVFSSLIQVARMEVVEGLAVDPSTGKLFLRTITAEQAAMIVEDNEDILASHKLFPYNANDLKQQLQSLIATNIAGSKSLVAWDDASQKHALSYCITKDDRDKRLTLVFLDTPSNEAGVGAGDDDDDDAVVNTDVSVSPLDLAQEIVELPASIVNSAMPVKSIKLHKQLYKHLFEPKSETESSTSKYDDIFAELKQLSQAYPKFKLYVTGHHTAGALATICSFFLACHVATPKPVSCITFGAPRVGDYDFLQASTALEGQRFLRILRVVHQADAVLHTSSPLLGFSHAGFQIRLGGTAAAAATTTNGDKDETAEPTTTTTKSAADSVVVSYPKLMDTCWNRFTRSWDNRFWAAWAMKNVDMATYMNTVSECKGELQELDVNELYIDQDMVGYEIAPLPVDK
mmetsp:Transcript_11192/g.14725  ORF Transcript_11192/g.14725 Transcript_11192/m.14725 type:complete len:427 (+) Transcript_11192:258-1538(+)|eukprot:CAMPEP_0198148544 /NCGR_PEP_ID=MMETSP1443-20131203/41874_1 /TAXON_ID=186043 /ORGANISM="Entomoneis sp., Strain CCMP2396" /LENGTH=426 /DNA_ID=CAMNT_0043813253 /DNA_START=180 /DNA_END=1460 /DNA_ORIENTATION=-